MQVETNQGLKYYGFYRGKVLQHCDNGICKIFIPGVYPEMYDDQSQVDNLPEAEQASPLFGGVNSGNGMFSYPNINSIVWCFFQNGDQNYPVYFASTLGGEPTDSASGEWSEIRDNVNKADEISSNTTMNGYDSQQHLIKCNHSTILIKECGTIEITSRHHPIDDFGERLSAEEQEDMSKITINEDGEISMTSKNSIILNSDSCISLNAPYVTINGEESLTMICGGNSTYTVGNHLKLTTGEMFDVKSNCIRLDATNTSNATGCVIGIGKIHGTKTLAD